MLVVVLNFMHSSDTLRCVRSLASSNYDDLQLVVVDNGSGSKVTSELRQGLDATVDLVEAEQNLGYAAGNNIGLSIALDRGAEFAWVVNPDVVVDPTALGHLVETANRYPDAAIVGSRILYGGSDPSQIWFDGGVIDWEAAGSTSHLHMGALESENPPGTPYDVDYVTGAGILMRTMMLRDVGLIPEDWFLYFEETDFNLRVRKAGWRTLVDPRSRLHHYKRSTGAIPQSYYVYYFIRNRYIFGMEQAGASQDEVGSDLTQFIETWRSKVSRNRPDWVSTYDRLVAAGTKDGIEGRRGPRDLSELDSGSAA